MVLKHVLVLFSLLAVGFARKCHVCGDAKVQTSNVGLPVYGSLCKDEGDLGKNNTECPEGYNACAKFSLELSEEAKKGFEQLGQLGDVLKGLGSIAGGQAGPAPDIGLAGKEGTIRGCVQDLGQGNQCRSQGENGQDMTICMCTSDNCNGAESLGRSGVLVLFTTLFLASCTKLFA